MSGEWAVIEPMEGEEVISDICLLAKKEKVPSGYTVVRKIDTQPGPAPWRDLYRTVYAYVSCGRLI